MFRLLALLVLTGIVATTVWAFRTQLIQPTTVKQIWREQRLALWHGLRHWRELAAPARLLVFMRCCYWVTLGSIAILALTGFLPVLILGDFIANFALMLHLLFAPFFALGMAALALFWAQRHHFNDNDWQMLRARAARAQVNNSTMAPAFWHKLCFWLSVVLAVPVIVSIALMMYPLFSTAGQDGLLHLHGYAGLLLVVVAVGHTLLILMYTRGEKSHVEAD